MTKKTLFGLFIWLSASAFAASLPKGIGAWLYAQDASWVTQLQYYNTQVAGKTDGANRQVRYLFTYAGSININAGGTGSFGYSPAPGAYYKAAFPSALILPSLDNANGANMSGWTLGQKQTLADNIAAAVIADSNANGAQVDIEPYTAAYHDAFYLRLKTQLTAAGKILVVFTGATSGNLYSSSYSDIVAFSGYDLGSVTNPVNYGSTLNTRVTTALGNAAAGGTKLLLGVPAAASAEEYQYRDGSCSGSTGYTQEQWFASALAVVCAKHFSAAMLGASLWGFFYQEQIGAGCYHHPEWISSQNIDGLININPPACTGPFIPTASITPTWSPTSAVPPTIIDDFSSAPQYSISNLNDLGLYTDDDSTMTSDLPMGGYLAIAGKLNGYWYSSLGNCYNAAGHDGISFDVRGLSGGETFNIKLIEKNSTFCGTTGNANTTTHSIPVTNYITVSTSWQTVTIPFSHFLVDPTRLFSFTLDGLANGQTIHLDNIQFATISGSPTPTPTPTAQINGAWPVITNFNGDITGNNGGGTNRVGNDNEDLCGSSASAIGMTRQTIGGHDASAYLRLTYTVAVNVGCGYQYASFAMPLPYRHDVSPFGSFRFWVRGAVGGEAFKIKVKSTNDGCVPGKNSMFAAVSATAGWAQVSIPFSAFANQIGGCPYLPGNSLNVDGVDLLVDTVSSGTLEFDDLEFVLAPPTATPTASGTATMSPSPTISPTFSFSPTDSPTALGSFTETPTNSPSGTYTDSPTPSPTPTLSSTNSPSPSRSPTQTYTPQSTPTSTFTVTPLLTPTPSFTPSPLATVPPTLAPNATPALLSVPNPASPGLGRPMQFYLTNPDKLNGKNARVELYSIGYTKVGQLECRVCTGPYLVFDWDGGSASGGQAGTGYYYAVFNAGSGARKTATKFVIVP